MNLIFIYEPGSVQGLDFPVGTVLKTVRYSEEPSQFHHGLCGVEADVVISDAPLSVKTVRYLLTRLRNPRNPTGGVDAPDAPICLWREYNHYFIRIGTETVEVTQDNLDEVTIWLEDQLEE